MKDTPDLNTISDEALRLALARALNRNAHLEKLFLLIGDVIKRTETFVLPIDEATYVKMVKAAGWAEYKTVAGYRKYYDYVTEDRNNGGDDKYPHECPFFSEAFLYDLFGKEEARTILALVGRSVNLATEKDYEIARRKEEQDRMISLSKSVIQYRTRVNQLLHVIAIIDGTAESWSKPAKTREEYVSELQEVKEQLFHYAIELAQCVDWNFK